MPIPRCRPEPRYSAGSPAIRNFAARTLSRASVTLKTSPSKPSRCADDSSRDYVKTTGVDGKVTWVFDKENFARQRLRIKARKMILARMAPRKYGNP